MISQNINQTQHLSVREATLADLASIFSLYRDIGEMHVEHAPKVFNAPIEKDRDFLMEMLNDPDRWLSVAETDGEVVGYVLAKIDVNTQFPFLSSAPICRLNTIVVAEAYKGKGVGQLLMKTCKDWAKENGAVDIRLEVMAFNERALSFYQREGFTYQSHIMSAPL